MILDAWLPQQRHADEAIISSGWGLPEYSCMGAPCDKSAMLQGEAQREVVRVTVECCLQEQTWNGYYAQLLGSLVRAVKGHRITLQFCLWDLIKQVPAHSPAQAWSSASTAGLHACSQSVMSADAIK